MKTEKQHTESRLQREAKYSPLEKKLHYILTYQPGNAYLTPYELRCLRVNTIMQLFPKKKTLLQKLKTAAKNVLQKATANNDKRDL